MDKNGFGLTAEISIRAFDLEYLLDDTDKSLGWWIRFLNDDMLIYGTLVTIVQEHFLIGLEKARR